MGASVAAIIVAKEKRIIEAFHQAGATVPEKALTLAAAGVSEGLAVRWLRKHAVLREAGPGVFYVDEPSWRSLRALRRRLAFIVAAIVVGAGALLWLIQRPG